MKPTKLLMLDGNSLTAHDLVMCERGECAIQVTALLALEIDSYSVQFSCCLIRRLLNSYIISLNLATFLILANIVSQISKFCWILKGQGQVLLKGQGQVLNVWVPCRFFLLFLHFSFCPLTNVRLDNRDNPFLFTTHSFYVFREACVGDQIQRRQFSKENRKQRVFSFLVLRNF